MTAHRVETIAARFRLAGPVTCFQPLGSGHINDTFGVSCRAGDETVGYVLQRINRWVFVDPQAMMENIRRVTHHIWRKCRQEDEALARRQLVVIETHEGAACHRDETGDYWRVYNRIEQAATHDTCASPAMAWEAARMFGWFGRMLADLPEPPLHETIPGFHATAARFQRLLDVLRNESICHVVSDLISNGDIPVRATHNDTKINNVMLDAVSGRGVCVIDLDTVMEGSSLYDFGDLVRTAANPAAEDEQDLSRVTMRIPVYEMLARGFVEGAAGLLNRTEVAYLAFACKLIAFEQMMRFLCDWLAGDRYYKVHREGQNLDRCRTQMRLVRSIVEQEEAMNNVAQRVFDEGG